MAVIFAVAGTISSLFILKVDVSVMSRGILRSSSEAIPLISPVIGQVERCMLAENMLVQKGDTLLVLDCEKIDKQIQDLQKLNLRNRNVLDDIIALRDLDFMAITTELIVASSIKYKQAIVDYELKISRQTERFTRAEKLFQKEVIPYLEFEEESFALNAIRQEYMSFVEGSKEEWAKLTDQYALEIEALNGQICKLQKEKENYCIRAPESGHITHYSGVRAGSFVTTGQNIAVISPIMDLVAEHLVSPKDIGLLRIEMPVVYQVDAYDFNQWGVASGVITEISKEVYLINDQPYFKVRSTINEKCLTLKNGYVGKIKKGLTTTAHYRIAQRTLAQLLFDKTEDWLNPRQITK